MCVAAAKYQSDKASANVRTHKEIAQSSSYVRLYGRTRKLSPTPRGCCRTFPAGSSNPNPHKISQVTTTPQTAYTHERKASTLVRGGFPRECRRHFLCCAGTGENRTPVPLETRAHYCGLGSFGSPCGIQEGRVMNATHQARMHAALAHENNTPPSSPTTSNNLKRRMYYVINSFTAPLRHGRPGLAQGRSPADLAVHRTGTRSTCSRRGSPEGTPGTPTAAGRDIFEEARTHAR